MVRVFQKVYHASPHVPLALNTKSKIFIEDISTEPRFSSEARESSHRSVICLPIFSNRGQTFGAIYLGTKYTFSPRIVTILSLLCEQASIGIANALLFRSVQAGTRENLKMIAAQREALEAARRSREDALKATKVWNPGEVVGLGLMITLDQKQFPGLDES